MKLIVILTTALALSGCASYRAFEKGRDFALTKKWDEAVEQYTKALEVDPDNVRYQMALQNARLEASRVHFEKGKSYMAADQPELAALEFELTVKLDPTNQFALVELTQAVEKARRKMHAREEMSIDERKRRVREDGRARPPQLDPASDEPISLSFPRETPIKEIYRALGNAFGINILFDQQVKDDPVAIELRDVTAQAALERVMQAGGHFYKVLDERSIIVVPDNPQARREYEDLVIQTFYLSNGDAEQVTNVVRTMLEARNVFPLKALNAITIRDTADKVRIAEQIIAANDKAKAEVVVSVELLQLDVTKARDVGMQIAGLGLGTIRAFGSDGNALGSVTLDQFRDLTVDSFTFTMPSVTYGFVKSNSEAQVLARPQLRISEGETATLHIGRKIPLPVSTFTSANPSQGGTFAPVTSYTYNDVGIKISLEPRVHHNREVTLKLKVEVSDIGGFAPDTNPPQPIISTRTIESVIRLKDGETNFLAGLIKEDDTRTNSSTPFLGDIPLIGRLFAKEDQDFARTDLVLTMTPHIIRIANITDDDLAPMWVGTGTNLTFRGVSPRIESQAPVDPFSPVPGQFTPPPPVPESPEPVTPDVNVPSGAAPTDIFMQPQPVAPPPPQPPPPSTRNPATYRPNGGMASVPGSDGAADGLGTEVPALPFTPRIAPQPISLELGAGEERDWSIFGMDLSGMGTPEIRIHFNPAGFEILDARAGGALELPGVSPPVIYVDAGNGLVTVRASDGGPVRFNGGGEILRLRMRGTGIGVSYLVLADLELIGPDGSVVDALVQGGRIEVR